MNPIEQIFAISKELSEKKFSFTRSLTETINWKFPVVGIIGQRGVGKTTLMLQKLSQKKNGIYFSADNIRVLEYGIFNLVSELYSEYEIQYFYIDEIHKFPNWEQEIKNCTDSFPNIFLIFSGSSSIDILSHSIDLSRRVLIYHMNPLSFREYMYFSHNIALPRLSLSEIFTDHKKISAQYGVLLKNKYFEEYKTENMYFFRQQVSSITQYYQLLENTVKKTIYEDIGRIYRIPSSQLVLFERLLFLLSNIEPSEMSYNNIAKKISSDPKTTEYYLSVLEKAGLVHILKKYDTITNALLKSKKIFLSNSNLSALYRSEFKDTQNTGMQREISFVSSIKRTNAKISLHSKYDFLIEHKGEKYICEVGGTNKKISSPQKNTFIIADNTKISTKNIIPSWMFGCIE